MRTIAFLPAGVALIALLVSLAPLATSNSLLISATGTFTQRLDETIVIPVEDEEDLCVLHAFVPFDLTGTLAGFAIETITVVQEAPCAVVDVPLTLEGNGAFFGTLALPDGTVVAGTFGFEVEGRIEPTGDAEARVTIESGTGALAGLDGELIFAGNFATGITYSGELELDD